MVGSGEIQAAAAAHIRMTLALYKDPPGEALLEALSVRLDDTDLASDELSSRCGIPDMKAA